MKVFTGVASTSGIRKHDPSAITSRLSVSRVGPARVRIEKDDVHVFLARITTATPVIISPQIYDPPTDTPVVSQMEFAPEIEMQSLIVLGAFTTGIFSLCYLPGAFPILRATFLSTSRNF